VLDRSALQTYTTAQTHWAQQFFISHRSLA
jgi:hypothetical protein